jgi:hypothetical protein
VPPGSVGPLRLRCLANAGEKDDKLESSAADARLRSATRTLADDSYPRCSLLRVSSSQLFLYE